MVSLVKHRTFKVNDLVENNFPLKNAPDVAGVENSAFWGSGGRPGE
jgi:hypothetical protein